MPTYTVDELPEKARRKAIDDYLTKHYDDVVNDQLRWVIEDFVTEAKRFGIHIRERDVVYDLERAAEILSVSGISTESNTMARTKNNKIFNGSLSMSFSISTPNVVLSKYDKAPFTHTQDHERDIHIDVDENIIVTNILYKICQKCDHLIAGAIEGSCSKSSCRIIKIIKERIQKSWEKFLKLQHNTLLIMIKTYEECISDDNIVQIMNDNEVYFFPDGTIVRKEYLC
jgi:hypothetical protein